MESHQRRGGPHEEPHDDFWDEDPPTQHVDAVGADPVLDDERPEFVPYEPEKPEAASGNTKTSPWVIIGAILAAIVAMGAGVWAYSAFKDNADDASSESAATSTVVVSQDPATEEEQPPADDEEASETEEPAPVTNEPEQTRSAPTMVTFDEGQSVEPVRPDAPEPGRPQISQQRPSQDQRGEGNSSRAPESALQCAANVNWRVFSTTGNGGCGNAEEVAVAMAPHSGSGQDTIEVPLRAQEGQRPASAKCTLVGDNSYECQARGVTVFLEDRPVRD